MWAITAALAALTCSPIATDGDTFRCGDERIRLLGIDAPEMSGHCRVGRTCVPGNPQASKTQLTRALKDRPLVIERVGRDRYGRTLAAVSANGEDVSCRQIRTGSAIYVRKWDNGRRIAAKCPEVARPD